MDNTQKPHLQVDTHHHHPYRKEVTSPTESQTRDYREIQYNDYGFLSAEIATIAKSEKHTPVADESNHRRNSNVSILQTPIPQVNMTKIVLVMVGLPARGKSHISQLLSKYLNWLGIKTRVFNVGQYRRKVLGAGQKSDFWNPESAENVKARTQMSLLAIEDMIQFLLKDGQISILDATNTTRERRSAIIEHLLEAKDLKLSLNQIIFIESICNDPEIITKNVENIKIKSSDYENVPPEEAKNDFLKRISQYEKIYEPLDEVHDKFISFIKLINVNQRIVMNRLHGYIPGRITSLLMNTHIVPRRILLSRHGESVFNTEGKIGGDSPLSEEGQCYAKVLPAFIHKQFASDQILVWTSTLQRTKQTAKYLNYPMAQFKALEEIDSGICDGMTYREIEEKMPEEWKNREQNKFTYKYPRGESYEDLVNRLEPVIVEMERQKETLLIVSHQAVTRVLYAYLTNRKPESCTKISIPLHTVIEIIPNAYGVIETRHNLDPLVQAEFEKTFGPSLDSQQA